MEQVMMEWIIPGVLIWCVVTGTVLMGLLLFVILPEMRRPRRLDRCDR